MGQSIMVENVDEALDPLIDQVTQKDNIILQAGQKVIQIGAGVIEYNDNFKLYLITNLPTPRYSPQTLTKVSLINFTITLEAAKDQMLSILAKEEDEILENEKVRLMYQNAENKQKLFQLEQSILALLSSSENTSILDDETLIN